MKIKISTHPYEVDHLQRHTPCRHCKYESRGLYFFSYVMNHGDTICPKCRKPITSFSGNGLQCYIDLQKQFFADLKKAKKSTMYFYKKVAK